MPRKKKAWKSFFLNCQNAYDPVSTAFVRRTKVNEGRYGLAQPKTMAAGGGAAAANVGGATEENGGGVVDRSIRPTDAKAMLS
ncbi:hypothetical protein D3C72_2274630 [compost metagenome]